MFEFGIIFYDAIGADAVTEICLRMMPDVGFHLFPETVIIADFFTVTADGDNTL